MVSILEAHAVFWMSFSFSFFSKESMQEFQEWFSGIKAAARASSDRTGDSKVLEAKLHELQVAKLALPFLLQTALKFLQVTPTPSLSPNLISLKLIFLLIRTRFLES